MADEVTTGALLSPLEFRFLEEADQEKYGDRWYRYDETAIVRLPAKRLVQLETAMSYSIRAVMRAVRGNEVLGDLCAMWLSIALVDPALAGPFDDFSPLVMRADWRAAVDDDLGKDGEASKVIQEIPPTVTLDSMPVAASESS